MKSVLASVQNGPAGSLHDFAQRVPRDSATRPWLLLPPPQGGNLVLVLGPGGRHTLASRYVSQVCHGYSRTTIEQKICRWLERAFVHMAPEGDLWQALMRPRRQIIRWFREFLIANGCTVSTKNLPDGSMRVTRHGRSACQIATAMIAMRRLYEEIGDLYPDQNPFERAGWTREQAQMFRSGQARFDPGNQFRVVEREWSPPRLYDSRELFGRVLEAGVVFGWPTSVTGIVRVMGEGGGRFCDVSPLTYLDWAEGSSFGLDVRAPNKGSRGERVKSLSFSEETRELLEDATEARHRTDLAEIVAGRRAGPPRPDMAEVRELAKTERGRELLKRLPLFPASHERPYSWSGFADHWFKRAMEKHAVLMDGPRGQLRPTPHWLRHFYVEERLRALPDDLTPAEMELEEAAILADMCLATNQLRRYGAHHGHESRIRRQRAHAQRISQGRSATVPPTPPARVGPGAARFRGTAAR